MPEPQYAPNNTIDPITGFIENNAYLTAFNGPRKTEFIKCLVSNGLSLYDTCDKLGLSVHTVNKHYQNDPVFKNALDEARADYADRLDGVSKRNAMNPKSVIERIFQLKSLFPSKYADQKNDGNLNIVINIDNQLLSESKKRVEALEAEILSDTPKPVNASLSTTKDDSASDNKYYVSDQDRAQHETR